MRLGVVPENPIEWLALRAGVSPAPLLESFAGPLMGRILMAATKDGAFEALAAGPLGDDEVAVLCDTDR